MVIYMNYVVGLNTYILLMLLGRVLLFVDEMYLINVLLVFIYSFFVTFLLRRYTTLIKLLWVHAGLIFLIQFIVLSFQEIKLLSIIYVCFVSVICVWMHLLRVEYKELCQKLTKNSK